MDESRPDHADPVPGAPPDVPAVGPVEADAPIPTQAVELPPVTLAAPPAAPGPRRLNGRAAILLAVLGVLAIGGVSAFGYSLTQDLTATRATLASTETDLGATKSTLGDTSASLDKTTATLTAAASQRTDLEAQVRTLSAQVADQSACLVLQRSALADLSRIEDLQTDNFNKTTEGTTWAKADLARQKAVTAALDDYYQAYSKAFDRALSAARSWAAKGKDAEATIDAQAKKQAAEIVIVDQSAKEIAAAIDALEVALTTTETACEKVSK
jgi:chromosome segregation ATPase